MNRQKSLGQGIIVCCTGLNRHRYEHTGMLCLIYGHKANGIIFGVLQIFSLFTVRMRVDVLKTPLTVSSLVSESLKR